MPTLSFWSDLPKSPNSALLKICGLCLKTRSMPKKSANSNLLLFSVSHFGDCHSVSHFHLPTLYFEYFPILPYFSYLLSSVQRMQQTLSWQFLSVLQVYFPSYLVILSYHPHVRTSLNSVPHSSLFNFHHLIVAQFSPAHCWPTGPEVVVVNPGPEITFFMICMTNVAEILHQLPLLMQSSHFTGSGTGTRTTVVCGPQQG